MDEPLWRQTKEKWALWRKKKMTSRIEFGNHKKVLWMTYCQGFWKPMDNEKNIYINYNWFKKK